MENSTLIKKPHSSILINPEIDDKTKIALFVEQLKTPLVPQEVFLSNHEEYPTFQVIKFSSGKEVLFWCVLAMVNDLIKSLNVVEQVNEDQVYEMASEIIAEYPTYKIEDLRLFFQGCKKGIYSTKFYNFNIFILFSWLKKYNEERNERYERVVINSSHNVSVKHPVKDYTIDADGNEIKLDSKELIQKIHSLYDKVLSEQIISEKIKLDALKHKEAAVSAWQEEFHRAALADGIDMNTKLASVEATEWAKIYISKYPLNETYIKNFKQ